MEWVQGMCKSQPNRDAGMRCGDPQCCAGIHLGKSGESSSVSIRKARKTFVPPPCRDHKSNLHFLILCSGTNNRASRGLVLVQHRHAPTDRVYRSKRKRRRCWWKWMRWLPVIALYPADNLYPGKVHRGIMSPKWYWIRQPSSAGNIGLWTETLDIFIY